MFPVEARTTNVLPFRSSSVLARCIGRRIAASGYGQTIDVLPQRSQVLLHNVLNICRICRALC